MGLPFAQQLSQRVDALNAGGACQISLATSYDAIEFNK